MTVLRAVTLWQPWASLVIVGAKPFEFRGYPPPRTIVGERIVIHAATKPMDRTELLAMLRSLERGSEGSAELCLHADKAIPVLKEALDDQPGFPGRGTLPWGCGLGTAICGEGRNGVEIAREEFGCSYVDVGDELDANFGWPLTEIERWEPAVEARGKQGIWFWPYANGAPA